MARLISRGALRGGRVVATARCAAITKGGSRCRLDATHGSYCYQHSPETAEERRRNARKGGRAGGNGRSSGVPELVRIKGEIRGVLSGVLSERVERGTGSVLFMGFNTLLRAVEIERKWRELDELEERIAALEARREVEGRRWRA